MVVKSTEFPNSVRTTRFHFQIH